MSDTIYAVSSGQPPAAIAVIRVSGPGAVQAAARLAGEPPKPRMATLRALRDEEGALLDRALVLVFPGPNSATGEDLVELHCHGGRAVVAAVEAALGKVDGLRRAGAGEFTRRALANGRIDLAEAEGLADLLAAETEAQRVAALQAAEGRISRAVQGWLARVALLSARVEASLDYADEDDVAADEGELDAITREAVALGQEIGAAAEAAPVERLYEGVRVVLAGPPNSGKSTLLNLLAERDAAIVSPVAGTTRDRVEAGVRRGGRTWLLTDTAGLTKTADPVEAIGVERAREALVAADLLVWLGDDPPPREDAIWLHARADVEGRREMPIGPALSVTREDQKSVDDLWTLLEQRSADLLPAADALPLKRGQRDACATASSALLQGSGDALILAEQLRMARTELTSITGANATETMLDALFSRFCVGK